MVVVMKDGYEMPCTRVSLDENVNRLFITSKSYSVSDMAKLFSDIENISQLLLKTDNNKTYEIKGFTQILNIINNENDVMITLKKPNTAATVFASDGE